MSKHFRQEDEARLTEQFEPAAPLPIHPRAFQSPVIDIESLGRNNLLVRCEGVMLSLKDGESFVLQHNGKVWNIAKVQTNYKTNCEK